MRRYFKILLFWITILFFITAKIQLHGQESLVKSFDIRTENTRPKILKLIQDKSGLIWVGTDNGLFTFNGINFIRVPTGDSLYLPVSAIFEDSQSIVWVGFENGRIIKISRQKLLPFNPKEGLPKVAITSFTQNRNGSIYFSTKGEGVYCIENNLIYNINHDDGLSDDYCYSMISLPDQRMCVGTDKGLNFVNLYNGIKQVTNIGTSEGLPDDIARSLAIGKSHTLWIGLQERGISKFDYEKNKFIPFLTSEKWKYGQINCILPIDNRLWVATERFGIVEIGADSQIEKLKLNGHDNLKANSLMLDSENLVWISESIHLFRTTGNKIKIIETIGDKKIDFVHSISKDKNENIWLSPNQHLVCLYKEGGYKHYKEYKIFEKHTDIATMYFDPFGFLWLGTMGEGIYRFNPANGHYKKITSFADNEKPSILSINGYDNIVWVAGFNSVMKFNILKNGQSESAEISSEKVFTGSPILNDYVYSVFIDSKKRTWFGTDENGVFMLDHDQLRNVYRTKNAIHSFTEDKKGRIWFTVADEGIKYFNGGDSISVYQTKDGLSDPSPTSLFCTPEGKIIIIHPNGFDVLDPETGTFFYHSSEENLSDLNPDINSFTYTFDNTLWIGTERGIVLYNTVMETNKEQPNVVLRSISIYTKPIEIGSSNNFSCDENNFRFDFDGIWYSDPQKINYYFMLEGFSNKWEVTKDHTVTFPILPPSSYKFRIKASLNSNFSTSEETVYSFKINPPFWQTWWFRILTAGLISFIVFMIIRRRESRIRKFDLLQKEKIEFQFETLRSQVNPHFLFNSFNTLITVIENTPTLAVEYVERLSEFFRNIINYKDQNVIKVSEELSLLDNYIFIQKKRYGESLILEINIPQPIRENKFVPPLTLQLLAENAIKHNAVSKETPLKITIYIIGDKMVFVNNINLKITREVSTGLGLQNIINRYKLLTTETVDILNENDIFTVTIPLLNKNDESTNH